MGLPWVALIRALNGSDRAGQSCKVISISRTGIKGLYEYVFCIKAYE